MRSGGGPWGRERGPVGTSEGYGQSLGEGEFGELQFFFLSYLYDRSGRRQEATTERGRGEKWVWEVLGRRVGCGVGSVWGVGGKFFLKWVRARNRVCGGQRGVEKHRAEEWEEGAWEREHAGEGPRESCGERQEELGKQQGTGEIFFLRGFEIRFYDFGVLGS